MLGKHNKLNARGFIRATARDSKNTHDVFIYIILLFAIWSRYHYIFEVYNYNFSSGDAYGLMLRALYFRNDVYTSNLRNLWGTPFFVPWLLSFTSKIFDVPLEYVPFVITPLVTCFAIIVLYLTLKENVNKVVALFTCLLLAFHPMFSFLSTEPLKAPYVVSFFIFSLHYLYKSKQNRKFLLLSGLFLTLSFLSYHSAIFFFVVLALTYLFYSRFTKSKLLDKYVLGLIIIVLFGGIWLVLQKMFTGTFKIGFMAGYVQVAKYNIIHGFPKIAGTMYINAIKRQITPLIFYLSIAGFLFGLWEVLKNKKMNLIPFLLWFIVVTGGIALQHPAASHKSRYPFYVIPVFLFFAGYFLTILLHFIARHRWQNKLQILAVSLTVLIVAFTLLIYANTYVAHYRHIYYAHKEMGLFLDRNHFPDEGKIMYLRWPSLIYHYYNGKIKNEDRQITFGWQKKPAQLDWITENFIKEQNVKYFVYDHVASDYINTAGIVFQKIKSYSSIQLIKVKTIEDKRYGPRYIVLYKLIF